MKKFVFTLLAVLFTAQIFGQNTITVVSPNGGENWIIGCPAMIQWLTTGNAVPVRIELFQNNTFSTTICSQVPAGMNTFTWIPPYSLVPGNNYKVKVSSLTSTTGFDFSDGNFSISRGSITVGSPNGGETWVKGTMHPITWTDNVCENVRIELWKGAVIHSVIAQSVPSNGTFNWMVPNVNTLVPGADYKVKIMTLVNSGSTTAAVYDFSDNNFTILQGQNSGQITVIAPNGGENWIIGCPCLIHWVTVSPAGPVKIELFKNDALNMTICGQVPAGQSTFTWIPPYSVVPGNNYKVKVSSLTSATGFDFSDGNFSISRGSITVGSPNGGETWVKGTMHPIIWTDNVCENVRIELWKGAVIHSVIAQSVPSNGTFNWMVPNVNTLVPGSDYKVKIMTLVNSGSTTAAVYDFSDNNFSILQGQNSGQITVIAPNGGENWIIGCPCLIQWVTVSPAGPVKIELFKNDALNMTICGQVPAGQSTFTWIPPYSVVPGNNYKVKVSSLTSTTGFDFSDGNFSISRGSITVGSPNGGETWVKGTMHPIIWTDNVCENVRIELWKGAVIHSVIAQSVPSNGTFNWMVPNVNTLVPGSDYKVKIMTLVNSGSTTAAVYDFSDNNFTIAGNSPPRDASLTCDIMAYPNPFSDVLHVLFHDAIGSPVSIEIVNINGDLMLSHPLACISANMTVDLNTSELPVGKYLVILKSGNGIISTRHILLAR